MPIKIKNFLEIFHEFCGLWEKSYNFIVMVYFTKGISLQATNSGRLRQLNGKFKHNKLTFEVN